MSSSSSSLPILIKKIKCFQTIENLELSVAGIKATSTFVILNKSPPGTLFIYGLKGNARVVDEGVVRTRYINSTGSHTKDASTGKFVYLEEKQFSKSDFDGPYIQYKFPSSWNFDIERATFDGEIEIKKFSIPAYKLEIVLKKTAKMHCGLKCSDVSVEMFDLSRISCGRVERNNVRWVVENLTIIRHDPENRVEGILVTKQFSIVGTNAGVVDVKKDRHCRMTHSEIAPITIDDVNDIEFVQHRQFMEFPRHLQENEEEEPSAPSQEFTVEDFMPTNVGFATFFPEFRFSLAPPPTRPPRVRRTPRVSQALLDASFQESVDRQFASSIDLSQSFVLPESQKAVAHFTIEKSPYDEIVDCPPKRESQAKCTICLDNAACVEAIPCGHKFACLSCAETHRHLENRCPQCRMPIKSAVAKKIDSDILNFSFDLMGASPPSTQTPASEFTCKSCGKNEANTVYSCGDRSDCFECCTAKRGCDKPTCSVCQKTIISAIILK